MSLNAILLPDNDAEASEVQQILSSNLHNQIKLKTVPIFSIHLLISLIISLTGIGFALIWPDEKRCEAYFIMLYLRALFWLITFIFDHIVKHQHDVHRMNGYLEFNRMTAVHSRLPLYVVSLWNTVVLAIQTLIHQYYGTDFGVHCIESLFSPIIYIMLLSITESAVLTCINGTYIARVLKFNKAAQPPDALLRINMNLNFIGFTDNRMILYDLIDKQADLIGYLKDHNFKLNEQLMKMHQQLRNSDRSE